MAEERNSENNVPEIVIDYDNSNILYEDDMDVASEVVVETYSHQQQENSVYACEVSTVQPLVYESYAVPDYGEDNSIAILANVFQNALPDEQREMLEIKSNPEGSGIFTTHSVEINSDEVTVTTNSPQNRTDPIIDQKFLNEKKNIAITKEMSPDLQSELDPAPIEIDGVCHQTEMMNDEKPGASEGFNSAHHMLTRSAAKAAKSASHSAEEDKTQKKRKGSRANSTSSGDTSAHSLRASSSPKKMPKKPRCS